ncbi:MAG: GAF domain-containing protein [Planctomycetia bacterium]|nr:GAF domain-containing protein [Planctomycetia bacterium]
MDSEFYEKHLRTFPSEKYLSGREDIPLFGSLPDLFRSFQKATGYYLKFVRAGGTLPASDRYSKLEMLHREAILREMADPESLFAPEEDFLQKEIFSEREIRSGEQSIANDLQEKPESPEEEKSSLQMLACIPVLNIQRRKLGNLVLWKSLKTPGLIGESPAIEAAQALAATIGETYSWANTVRERETELAALSCCLFNSRNRNHGEHLYEILKDGAQMIHCEASAFFLLDENASCLKLRSAWGLPEERFTAPPRPLNGALADLEALLGNAVILNESYLAELWKSPECFSSSICVPVISDSTVLGTLWFFCDEKRDFDQCDMNILELVAGKIVLELENIAIREQLAQKNRIKSPEEIQ